MKNKYLIVFHIVVSTMFGSCTNCDIYTDKQTEEISKEVVVTIANFNNTEEDTLFTRTSTDLSNGNYVTSWTEGDCIDIYSLSAEGGFRDIATPSNSHVKFEITKVESNDNAWARFAGNGYGLLDGYEYAAYYPYVSGNDYPSDKVELNYDYSSTTITPNSTDHIKDYDYLVSDVATPVGDHYVVMNFHHVGSLVRLRAFCPNAGIYTRLQIASDDADGFVTKATLNVADGTTSPVKTSSTINIPITPTEVSAGGYITVYVMMYPKDFSSKRLYVRAMIDEDNGFEGSVAGKNLQAGNAESISGFAKEPYSDKSVDLGLSVMWAKYNVGSTEVASTEINSFGLPDYVGQYYCYGETTGYGEAPTPYSDTWTGETTPGYLNMGVRSSWPYQNYKWFGAGGSNPFSKYNHPGVTEELEPEDDAATVNWGHSWYTPSQQEIQELIDNCYWVYTDNYKESGIKGHVVFKVKSDADKGVVNYWQQRISGYEYEDNHIFLPNCGYMNSNMGNFGFYMTKTNNNTNISGAVLLYLPSYSSKAIIYNGNGPGKYQGVIVRPVRHK